MRCARFSSFQVSLFRSATFSGPIAKRLRAWRSAVIPKLAIPIFTACLMVYLLMTAGLIMPVANRPALTGGLAFEPSLDHLFAFSFYRVFFAYSHDQSYVPPLWTMSIELMGSIIVFCLLAVFGRLRMRMLVYCVVASLLIANGSYYALFVFGIILAEMFNTDYPPATFLWSFVLVFGLVISFIVGEGSLRGEMLGVASLVAAAIFLPSVRRLFETRTSAFLGRISFPLYLIHAPVMASFSLWLLTTLTFVGLTPEASRILVALVSIPVCIAAALVFSPVNTFAILVARSMGAVALGPPVRHRRADRTPRQSLDPVRKTF